ncbi:MAG: hypothetical protein WC612_06275 [Bdellovibrionales bacterium]|jgi:hypothetical protein
MTNFIDTYLKSKSREAMESLSGFVTTMIPVAQGIAATQEMPAAGDPDYFYTCVRSVFPIPPFGEVEACGAAEGEAVVGVFL